MDSIQKHPTLREGLHQLLQNIGQPIILNAASDVVKYFNNIRNYIGFLGKSSNVLQRYTRTIILFNFICENIIFCYLWALNGDRPSKSVNRNIDLKMFQFSWEIQLF